MESREEIRNIVRDVLKQVLYESPSVYIAPWTGVEYEAHPSRQQFNVNEATTGAGELLEFAEAERCSIEKTKACDHCGMCRSLGF